MILSDGRLIDAPPRVVPPADVRGVFTTVGCEQGRVLLWERHRQRLLQSLWVALPEVGHLLPREDQLLELLQVEGLGAGSAGLRVVVGLGERPWVEACAAAAPEVGSSREPVRLKVESWKEPPDAAHKIIARQKWHQESENARADGFDDVLLVDREERILETSVANVFVRRRGIVVTPPAPRRCLPGLMRGWLLENLASVGFFVEERDIQLEELLKGDEVWITNSLNGALRVGGVDKQRWAEWSGHRRLVEMGLPAPGW